MALLTRKIKRQIQSVKNTQKITKAMELVSGAKMRKAVNAVLTSRPYSNLAWQTVATLSNTVDRELHALLFDRQTAKKIGVVLISANRGLCGVFNQQIAREALRFVQQEQQTPDVEKIEFITLGHKGAQIIAKSGNVIASDFTKPDVVTDISEISSVAKMIVQQYIDGDYDKVVLVYTDFINSLKQRPEIKQLLPIKQNDNSGLGKVGQDEEPASAKKDVTEYLFEPSADFVLSHFLPRLIEVQIYQAILESNASEHSARMVAMKNASDAASDLINELTLSFNKARQAGITQEISEISVSKAALEG
ncbi:MAG: ATP synthase F1 subunit gamma [Candidatus Buchananbacteria bacterium]|nr:ATP synthase F1 subunit gamma [Candidatus Buchananbacteria bacterium]